MWLKLFIPITDSQSKKRKIIDVPGENTVDSLTIHDLVLALNYCSWFDNKLYFSLRPCPIDVSLSFSNSVASALVVAATTVGA